MNNFRSSFQFRLFLLFTLLTALTALFFSALYLVSEIREERTHAGERLQFLARHLADSVRLPLYAENQAELHRLAQEIASEPEMRKIVITLPNGRVMTDIHLPEVSNGTEVISETVEVRSIPLGSSVETAISGDKGGGGALIGSVRLQRGTADLARRIHKQMLHVGIVALVFWFSVSFFCYRMLRRVTRSFQTLVEGVKLMQQGDYTARIDVTSDDEPGRVAHAVNQLAASLQLREVENQRLNRELRDAVQLEIRSKEQLALSNRSLEEEVGERIRAEQRVGESERTLRNLVEHLPVGVSWSGMDGTIEYYNRFLAERFDSMLDGIHTFDDFLSRTLSDPAYRAKVIEVRHTSISRLAHGTVDEEIPSFDARFSCKDGTVRHMICSNQISNDRVIDIMFDITDREMLQDQLIKNQKLESLGVLAGGVAHNFNNILTGILGYISFVRTLLDESHRASMPLEQAEKASKRAAAMAKQLLTFASGGSPVKKPLVLLKLVEECVSLALNGTNVVGSVHIPANLHTVNGDEDQLGQAITNIIINAAQSMPNGGTLTIRGENIVMPAATSMPARHLDYVKLTFSDQGYGIAAQDLKRIFDPYFTTKATGTGLGLSTVHSIVYKHDGQVFVDSEIGTGTTVTIYLPSMGGVFAADDHAAEEACFTDAAHGRVLVMDDEEMIRELAKDTLEFLGYQVTVCGEGEEAVALYERAYSAGEPFLAAILDLTVPGGMGGTVAAQRILAFDPDARLIVSSGYANDPIMARYRQHGFRAAVSKPYNADTLFRELSLLQSELRQDNPETG